jgi:hypothetical protein
VLCRQKTVHSSINNPSHLDVFFNESLLSFPAPVQQQFWDFGLIAHSLRQSELLLGYERQFYLLPRRECGQ